MRHDTAGAPTSSPTGGQRPLAIQRPEAATALAMVAVGLLALGVRLVYGPWPIDDAYITFRYARNLAAGLGFVYNAGELVLGTTTPGFTLLLVPAARLDLDLGLTAWAMALIADGLTAWLLYRLGGLDGRPAGSALSPAAPPDDRGSPGRGRPTAVLAGLLLLLSPKFVIWSSVSGMETSLYVLCLVGMVWLYWTGRRLATGVVFGLALWLRPDALLFGAAVGLHSLLTRRRLLLREGGVAALVVLPWVLFSWWYFGSPVPTSVLAKASSNDLTALQSVLALGEHFLATWYERLLLVPVLLGALATARHEGPGRLLILWGLLYGAVFGAAGAFGHHLWYFVPLYVPYFWCAAAGIGTLARWLGDRLGRQMEVRAPQGHPPQGRTPLGSPALRERATGTAIAGGLLLSGLLLWQLQLGLAAVVATHAEREDYYRAVATTLDTMAHGEALAATEVGALGWYYDGPVVDLVGLVTPDAIGRPYAETMRAYRPRWLVTYDDLFDDPDVLAEAWFRREWAPEAVYPISAERTLYVFVRTTG